MTDQLDLDGLDALLDFHMADCQDGLAMRVPRSVFAKSKAAVQQAREAERMRGAVAEAREVFHRYAQLHWSKGTPDGEAKAVANAQLAARMDQALAPATGGGDA